MAVANVFWQFATNCGVLPKGAMAADGLRREVREITVAGREGFSRRQTAKTWLKAKEICVGGPTRGAVFTLRSGKGKCFRVEGAKIEGAKIAQ